ncbi:MAG: ribosomal-protein-alanine N-acetyltransferase, partial [Gammaproteobacteria bacterium]|nr:ribosomal-protein-alanine N-acetyltransferase [Gammaproteobacteria bacterium]
MSAEPRYLPPLIREMRQTDLATVAGIERGAYEFPWSPGIFRDCLLAGYTSLVLEQGAAVIGYGIMSVAAGEA